MTTSDHHHPVQEESTTTSAEVINNNLGSSPSEQLNNTPSNIPSSQISPVKYTTELFCTQYTELLSKSTNQKEIEQEEQFKQIENLIEVLLKRCDELGENLDLIQTNSVQINDELLPNLLKMMEHVKQIYSKIDNLNSVVSNAKEKVNSLDLKLSEFEKQKSSEKYAKFVPSFFKFGKSSDNTSATENVIQFNKDDYLL